MTPKDDVVLKKKSHGATTLYCTTRVEYVHALYVAFYGTVVCTVPVRRYDQNIYSSFRSETLYARRGCGKRMEEQ
jgi:hypothetical protein